MATTYTDEERGAARRERHQAERAPRSGLWQRVKPRVAGLAAFWTKINNDGLFNLSAMLAYNFLMSAFPILLVLFTIGGLILTATGAGQHLLVNAIGSALPSGTAQNLLVHINSSLSKSAGLIFFVGIVLAIVTGSRLFITLEYCFGVIFRLRSRNVVRQNLMAIGMLLLYVVLIPIVLLTSVIPSTIVRLLGIGTNTPVLGFLIQAGFDALSVLLAAVLFAAIYIVVPNRRVRLREVWKGTLVAALLLVLYQALFPLYLSYFLHPDNYGSTAGFAVVILLFFYYLGVIILLGAEINSWAAGQRQTAAPINALLHEIQAHNSTRGAAGPTAGTPQEDIEHHKGAAAMRDERTAVEHERHDHSGDTTPPKFAESGVAAPGYNIESNEKDELERLKEGGGQAQTSDGPRQPRGTRDGEANRDGDAGMRERMAASNGLDTSGASRTAEHVNSAQAPASRPLTAVQKRTFGALAASVVVAVAPLVRRVAESLRGQDEDRPHALD